MKRIKRLGFVVVLTTLLSASMAGCGTSSDESKGQAPAPKVALILGGKSNDGGFNQSAADAITTLQREGLITSQIRDSVVNAADAEPILRQYASEGYLVIGWGLGFSDAVLQVGKQLPDAHLVATGGVDILQKATTTVETWTYDAQQLGFLNGFIAGTTKLSPVAVVDGEQAPFLAAQWDGFAQGLRAANPTAVQLPTIYTGSFEDAQKANQATTAQINAGAKLIATNAEGYSPGVASAAKAAGIPTVGMAATTSDAAKTINLGRVKTDIVPILREWVDRLKAGTFGSKGTTSAITNRSLVVDINPSATAAPLPADLDKQVTDLANRLTAGQISITPWKPGQ